MAHDDNLKAMAVGIAHVVFGGIVFFWRWLFKFIYNHSHDGRGCLPVAAMLGTSHFQYSTRLQSNCVAPFPIIKPLLLTHQHHSLQFFKNACCLC